MSDAAPTSAAATGGSAQFTERELQMLGWAMQSLKTGPPEIDYEKLAAFAGMGNPRSASNAWAKIKNKLGSDGATAPATPKKAGGRKKATGDDADTPKKSPRKRAAKKQDIDGEESPKKKGRGNKSAAAIGEDDDKDDAEDVKPKDKTGVEAEPENVEDEVEIGV